MPLKPPDDKPNSSQAPQTPLPSVIDAARTAVTQKSEETRVRLQALMERDGIPGEPPKRVLPLDKVPTYIELAAALHGKPPYEPTIALTTLPQYQGHAPDSILLVQEFAPDNYKPGRTYNEGELMGIVTYQYQFHALYFQQAGKKEE